tara:strand:+ start:6120 stop:6926 length:807 start_codon:yes stop_codon:yes gene_type:complete
MKIILFSGNHPRHHYLIKKLYDNSLLRAVVYEEREKFIPSIPNNLNQKFIDLFSYHFKLRDESENKFFGKINLSEIDVPIIKVDKKTNGINTSKVELFLKKYSCDIALSYGVRILENNILSLLPNEKWNIHGGLSPWFKGAITNFWPSYFLKPQYTGVTLHYLSEKIDAGEIIHQTSAIFQKGDGLHDLCSRTTKHFIDNFYKIIDIYNDKKSLNTKKQNSTGKLWLNSDWTPYHLDIIYNVYNDRIADLYLDGKIDIKKPNIFKQYE